MSDVKDSSTGRGGVTDVEPSPRLIGKPLEYERPDQVIPQDLGRKLRRVEYPLGMPEGAE